MLTAGAMCCRAVLWRGAGHHAVWHQLHVHPRRPRAPPLPGRPHRRGVLLLGCKSFVEVATIQVTICAYSFCDPWSSLWSCSLLYSIVITSEQIDSALFGTM
jgi:hypothetical protein